jgi:WXXGXW repeat (2 copies)
MVQRRSKPDALLDGGSMTKYGFLAAVPVLALGAPAFAQLQPVVSYPPPVIESAPPATTAPIGLRTDPITGDGIATLVLPPAAAVITPSTPPADATWVPGHYEWSSDALNDGWLPDRYVEQTGATWIAGHWEERPDRWIWVDGRWD